MSFPLNPTVGDVYEAENGRFEYTAKQAWKRLPPVEGETSGIPTHVGSTPPVGPRLGDHWYNPDVDQLYTWATDGVFYYWQLFSGLNVINTALSGSAAVDRLVPLTWSVGEPFAFEMWQADQRYNWRDFASVGVVAGTAGDDSLDLVSTEGVQAGQTYVVVNPDGTKRFTLDVFSVISGSRVRTRVNLPETLSAAQRLVLARTSFEIVGGYASVQNGDVFFSRWLTPLTNYVSGVMYLRRTATGPGVFSVRARQFGSTTWTPLKLVETTPVDGGMRDEQYAVPFGGVIQISVDYTTTVGNEQIPHMVLLPSKQGVDARRVDTPVNVSPLDNAINVSVTPMLQGSAFRSIYNLPQNGAEFQIAQDETFRTLVLNTSSDFLASWVAADTYAAPVMAVDYLEQGAFVAVAGTSLLKLNPNGVVQTTTPLGAAAKALATDGTRVLVGGANGSIAVSLDKAATVTVYTAAGGYTGDFRGAAVRGNFALLVGATGEIQRSINGGVIWSKIGTDNSYAGTFTAVDLTAGGYAIAVGTSGEIQTSANNGATWTKRAAFGGYTGTWAGVTLNDAGYAIAVGSGGEIQTSDDYGATWSRRTPASGYTGAFGAVTLRDTLALAVGAGGEIQTSKDRGVTWTRAVAASGFTGTWLGAALSAETTALLVGQDTAGTAGVSQRTLNLQANTTTYTVPNEGFLAINRTYWWRVRYQDSAGFWSEYSKPTVFATAATINSVKTPSNLTPAANATDVSQQPTLQTSLFAVTGTPDVHASTVYQISTSESMVGAQSFTSANAVELTTFVVPASANLQNQTRYWWRAKHVGTANGESAWSAATSFTVKLQSAQPTLQGLFAANPPATEPTANLTTYTYARVRLTNFVSAVPNDAYDVSEFQESPDGVTWSTTGNATERGVFALVTSGEGAPYRQSGVNRFVPDATVFVRARHRGTQSGWGPWSNVFKYVVPKITRGEAVFTTSGTFTVPQGVTRVCAVVVGAGGAGHSGSSGGSSSFGSFISAAGGTTPSVGTDYTGYGGGGGTGYGGDGGGSGGTGPRGYETGGGGAGGYTGNGGAGGAGSYDGSGTGQGTGGSGSSGSGGGGGGGGQSTSIQGGTGGGVGLYGQGANGFGGAGGSSYGDSNGQPGGAGSGGSGSTYGGGGGGDGGQAGGGGGGLTWKNNIAVTPGQTISVTVGTAGVGPFGRGGAGAVRVMWGEGRSFPNNAM